LSVSVSPVEVFLSPVTATNVPPRSAESSLERLRRVHPEEPRDPLRLAARRVPDLLALGDRTGVDAQKRQAPALAAP